MPDTTLKDAAASGNLPKVRELVEAFRQQHPAPESNTRLQTTVSTAILHGHDQVAAYLLQSGVTTSRSVVGAAIRANAPLEMFKLLLEHGWDVRPPAPERFPTGYGDLWLYVSNAFLRLTLFRETMIVFSQLIGFARALLGRGGEFTRLLLEHGADANAPRRKVVKCHTRPLDEAAAGGSVDSFRLLLEHGAELDLANPLHAAAASSRGDSVPMMTFLLDDIGLDINTVSNFRRWSPLQAGSENGTPQHFAVGQGDESRIAFLLDRSADPRVRNEYKMDVWAYARKWGYDAGLEVLKRWLARDPTKTIYGSEGGDFCGTEHG